MAITSIVLVILAFICNGAFSSPTTDRLHSYETHRAVVEESPYFNESSLHHSYILSTPTSLSQKGWSFKGLSSPNQRIDLTIALTVSQKQFNSLDALLLDISTPSSPLYGKHLTAEEVTNIFAPNQLKTHQILAWLDSYGIARDHVNFSSTFDVAIVKTTIQVAEKLLNTKYYSFSHANGVVANRVARYDIPDNLSNVISFISPSIRFPPYALSHTTRTGSDSDLDTLDARPFPTMDPILIKRGYGSVGASVKNQHPQTTVAIANFLDQHFAIADLSQFLTTYGDDSVLPPLEIFGPNDEQRPTREASLDVQAVASMAPHAPIEFWSMEGVQPDATVPDNEPFLELLLWIDSTTGAGGSRPLHKVLSISYGDDETTVSVPYAQRVNVEFMKLGLRGVSILVASGDGGVSGPHHQTCPGGKFVPVFPASSPYVTAVGGTTSFSPEIGASLSGGGFSRLFARPDYQKQDVNQYIMSARQANQLPDPSLFEITNRAYPDIAAQSLLFPGIMAREKVIHDGTSVSAPVVASYIALLNDARLQLGKGSLGFLNPLIYDNQSKNKAIFTDILTGNNPGCGTRGFSARAGWDPVTGMGSPNYKNLVSYISLLP